MRFLQALEALLGNLLLVFLATNSYFLRDNQLRFHRAIGADGVRPADRGEILDELCIILAVLHSSSPLLVDLRHRVLGLRHRLVFVVVCVILLVVLLGLLVVAPRRAQRFRWLPRGLSFFKVDPRRAQFFKVAPRRAQFFKVAPSRA